MLLFPLTPFDNAVAPSQMESMYFPRPSIQASILTLLENSGKGETSRAFKSVISRQLRLKAIAGVEGRYVVITPWRCNADVTAAHYSPLGRHQGVAVDTGSGRATGIATLPSNKPAKSVLMSASNLHAVDEDGRVSLVDAAGLSRCAAACCSGRSALSCLRRTGGLIRGVVVVPVVGLHESQ